MSDSDKSNSEGTPASPASAPTPAGYGPAMSQARVEAGRTQAEGPADPPGPVSASSVICESTRSPVSSRSPYGAVAGHASAGQTRASGPSAAIGMEGVDGYSQEALEDDIGAVLVELGLGDAIDDSAPDGAASIPQLTPASVTASPADARSNQSTAASTDRAVYGGAGGRGRAARSTGRMSLSAFSPALCGHPTDPASATASSAASSVSHAHMPPASGAGADDPHDPVLSSTTRVQDRLFDNTSDTEHDPSAGRQPAFEAAKRTVALYPHEQKERREELESIGRLFQADVKKALEGFPEVEMMWRDDNPVGFTVADMASILAKTGIKFVDAGGMAGGIKAVHEGLGLFMKFAFDQQGIYVSTRMAAKAAKREAAASRWVHAMDSVHVSTPLLECVDVPVRVRGAGIRMLRVQVYAKVDVQGADTLRVGSSDGGVTMHSDAEQVQDVVQPLARHFCLAGYDRQVGKRIEHAYHLKTSSTSSLDGPSRVMFDYLRPVSTEPTAVQRIKDACDPRHLELTEEVSRKLTKQQQELAQAVYDAIRKTGVNLDYRKASIGGSEHMTSTTDSGIMNLSLPFDVEVHQLPSGQRMVLDTHRLLIPDVPWMDWMESEGTKVRVFAEWQREDGSWHSVGGLLSHGLITCGHGQPSQVAVLEELRRWWPRCGQQLESAGCDAESSGTTFDKDHVHLHQDIGSVQFQGMDPDGRVVVQGMLSCPRWYYCGNMALTCLLPPDACAHLHKVMGPGHGLCPDLIMNPTDGGAARARAKEAIEKLYERARREGVARYKKELEIEVCNNQDFDPSTNHAAHRSLLKRVMHSFGLGLRHVRLLVERSDNTVVRHSILQSMAVLGQSRRAIVGCDADGTSMSECWAAAAMYATKGIQQGAGLLQLDAVLAMPDVRPAAQCVGTGLAAGGGLHQSTPIDAVRSLIAELAHQQRVAGGAAQRDLLVSLQKLAKRSCGLDALRIASISVQAQLSICQRNASLSASAMPLNGHASTTTREAIEGLPWNPSSLMQAFKDIAGTLQLQGKHSVALTLFKSCMRIEELAFGKEHPRYAASLERISWCYVSQDRYSEAMALLKQGRKIQEHTIGQEQPRKASTLSCMAHCMQEQGNYGGAFSVLEECRTIQERTIGKGHPQFAVTIGSMASCLEAQGKFDEALILHKECQSIQERTIGKEHQDYAWTLGNLAGCLLAQGRYTDALEILQKTRAIDEFTVGKEHPTYASTLNRTAACLQSMGRYDEALDLFEECRAIQEHTFGVGHPRSAATLGNIALCLASQGKYSEAIHAYNSCRVVQERTIGKEHPFFATTLGNMAECLQSQGKYDEALDLLRQCLQIRERVLGANHPDCASAVASVAGCLLEQGKHDDALAKYLQCQAIRERVLGKEHPDYLSTLGKMALCLMDQGKYGDALAMLEECRSIVQQVLGTEHPDYAGWLGNMGRCLMCLGKYVEALNLYEECRVVQASALGKQHPDYGCTLGNMAGCLVAQGKDEGALNLYRVCLTIFDHAFGKQHPHYASTLQDMAVCLLRQCKYSEAMPMLAACRNILERTVGIQHPMYASTLSSTAGGLLSQGKISEALDLLEKCLATREVALGTEHPDYIRTIEILIDVNGRHDRTDRCLELTQILVDIQARTLGPGNPKYLHSIANLVRRLVYAGKIEEAQAWMHRLR